MSIQFRTRVRSTVDFGAELKKVGKCCFTNGTSAELTFLECFQQNGNFYVDLNAICETGANKGYCCACSYLTTQEKLDFVNNLPYSITNTFYTNSTAGILSDITECECNRIGGLWSATNNASSLCQTTATINGSSTPIDVRIPQACCSFVSQDGVPSGLTCNNVCNARECANRVIAEAGGGDVYLDSTFKANSVCGESFVTGVDPATCASPVTISRMLIGNDVFENDELGPCFVLTESNNTFTYECDVKAKPFCSGYFIESTDGNFCKHKFAPKTPVRTDGVVQPITYTQQEFNALGLTYGDEFQGGIYIGVFKPKKYNTTDYSLVYGSLNFTTPEQTIVDVYEESPYSQWAIVLNKTYLTSYIFSDPIINQNYDSTYYNGYYNCYNSLNNIIDTKSQSINTISGKIRNGFADYYIPSIVEMMFLAEQYRNYSAISDIIDLDKNFTSSSIFDDTYVRSSPIGSKIYNNKNFLYAQSFKTGSNYGKTSLSGINSLVNFMLFRRIVII